MSKFETGQVTLTSAFLINSNFGFRASNFGIRISSSSIMPEPLTSKIHRIRLQGPWEWAVPTPSPDQAWTWSRIRLPDEWDRLPMIDGPVWFRRRFNAPTGITPTDRICVVLPTSLASISVNLNGQALAPLPSLGDDHAAVMRFELTPTLAVRNLLEIVFEEGISPSNPEGGLAQPVALEIETCPTAT